MINENNFRKEKFFTKKDFVYWIIFLIAVIVLVLVWRWSDEQQLTNQISLVGSVSSILLALVAISYAFFQTQRNSNENSNMLNTLIKINNEINKLESVNSSLSNIKKDLVTIQQESSNFQEKVKIDLENLRSSLEDKSWIDNLELDPLDGSVSDMKEQFKSEYVNHIKDKLDSAFRIDNEVMAKILSHIGPLSVGDEIDQEEILQACKKEGIEADSFIIIKELERLSKRKIVTFVVKSNDPSGEIVAIKSSNIEPLELVD